jgi:hypothetical protein
MRLVTVLLFFLSSIANAQKGPINVYYKSGRVVSTYYAYLFSGYDSYLRIHEKKGEKVSINLIDHIEGTDEKGNYRYIKPVEWGGLVWAERGFTSDRIVIYHTDIVTGSMAATHKPKSCLYSKDGGPLQPLKLKYLNKDLADCPESVDHLKKAKRIAKAQVAVYAASYSLIAVGIVGFISNSSTDTTEDEPESTSVSIPPTILIGALGAYIPFFMNDAKREKCLDALKVYK